MAYRIEVSGRGDAYAEQQKTLLTQIAELGSQATERVEITRLFFVDGELSQDVVERLTTEVLADDRNRAVVTLGPHGLAPTD